MKLWRSLFVLVLAAVMLAAGTMLVGCRSEPVPTGEPAASESETSAGPIGQQKAKAMAAKEALFKRLSGRLMEVMASDGPVAAIEVCSQEAQQLARSVGEEQGVRIGRTSFRLRNPQNTPPEWAEPLIDSNNATEQFISFDDGQLGALLPIKLQPQCLMCHGSPEQIADDVKSQLAALYPADAATGFQEGDLRGWFWVEVP